MVIKIRTVAGVQGVSCMPFVSTYSDCTEANQCTGCTRCSCSAEGAWVCQRVQECPSKPKAVDDETLETALKTLYSELNSNVKQNVLLPQSSGKSSEDLLLDTNDEIEQKIVNLMSQPRVKRDIISKAIDIENKKNKTTVMFFNTVDEINEDTLKHLNLTGTLSAKKVPGRAEPILSRRTTLITQNNGTLANASAMDILDHPLHIEHSHLMYQHLAENKIDVPEHTEDPSIIIKKDIEIGIVTNQTQKEKDADLSKILVNELKTGKEMIGDKNAPIMSNITFTPENDTLTAMAFIAGNLLNKLWSMQKDVSDEISNQDVDKIKHEKIADLIELFKEPLTIRQEIVLKSALEKLSEAMIQSVDPKNLTLCENIAEVKRLLEDAKNNSYGTQDKNATGPSSNCGSNHKHEEQEKPDRQKNATLQAVTKIYKVLELIKKYETVNKHLNSLKRTLAFNVTDGKPILRSEDILSEGDEKPLNVFGNILSKITKLLLPNQAGKKLSKKISKQNLFTSDDDNIKRRIKNLYKYDLGNASLTMKDRLVLDYLTKVETNPNRYLYQDEESVTPKSRLKIEGDILLNLSEFFKIKSFVDLLKHLDTGKSGKAKDGKKMKSTILQPEFRTNLDQKSVEELTEMYETMLTEVTEATKVKHTELTTKKPSSSIMNQLEIEETQVEMEMATEQAVTQMFLSTVQINDAQVRFLNTKAKFKSHLKAILDDLVELQREYGMNAKEGELRLADALPCIYNILQADKKLDDTVLKPTKNASTEDAAQKIVSIFNSLKEEFQTAYTQGGRRTNTINDIFEPRPHSALVWERLIKNVNIFRKKSGRRTEVNIVPKSFDDIKQMMDHHDAMTGSNTYKTIALYHGVEPADKLVLLRTIYDDVKKYLNVLPHIKVSLQNLENMPAPLRIEISNFIDNAQTSMNLDSSVLASVERRNNTMPSGFLKNFKSVASEESLSFIPQEDVRRPPASMVNFDEAYRVPKARLQTRTEKPKLVISDSDSENIFKEPFKNRETHHKSVFRNDAYTSENPKKSVFLIDRDSNSHDAEKSQQSLYGKSNSYLESLVAPKKTNSLKLNLHSYKDESENADKSINKNAYKGETDKSEHIILKTFTNDHKENQNAYITREDVLNQLVKNRIELYLKTKSGRGDSTDVKYNIARNILRNIELGNYALARELYKLFVQTSEKKADVPKTHLIHHSQEPVTPTARRQSLSEKIPLVNFEHLLGNMNDKNYKATRDLMLKKLLDFQALKLDK